MTQEGKSAESRWRKDSIEASRQPKEGRNLAAYELVLGFQREALRGKDILDLGTGPEGKFAKELAAKGIDAHVVGLSPDFHAKRHRERIMESDPRAQSVAALGQELPFKDESFDVVAAVHLLDHLAEEDIRAVLSEVARVLKQGGTAYVGPLFSQGYPNHYVVVRDDSFREEMTKRGVEITEEKISEAYGQEKLYDPSTGMGLGGLTPYSRLVMNKKL